MKLKEQVLLAAGLVTFSLLLGVFVPVLYLQLLDGYFLISAMLVVGIWIAWDGVRGLKVASALLPLRRSTSTAAVDVAAVDQAAPFEESEQKAESEEGESEGVTEVEPEEEKAESEEVEEAESGEPEKEAGSDEEDSDENA